LQNAENSAPHSENYLNEVNAYEFRIQKNIHMLKIKQVIICFTGAWDWVCHDMLLWWLQMECF